jgi:hypothetical protein
MIRVLGLSRLRFLSPSGHAHIWMVFFASSSVNSNTYIEGGLGGVLI